MEHLDQSEGKRCPVCQGKLRLLHENSLLRFDTPFCFGMDCLSMDVYECEDCRRLEFYNSTPMAQPELDPDEIETCPVCGTVHSKYINCPECLRDGSKAASLRSSKKKDKQTRGKKGGDPWDLK